MSYEMTGEERALAKARDYLTAWEVGFQESDTGLTIVHGTTTIWLAAAEYGDETLLLINTFLVVGVQPSDPLYRYVATNQPTIGQIKVWKPARSSLVGVLMSHALLADYLDEPEFRHALSTFASEADELDDTLHSLFGGTLSSPYG